MYWAKYKILVITFIVLNTFPSIHFHFCNKSMFLINSVCKWMQLNSILYKIEERLSNVLLLQKYQKTVIEKYVWTKNNYCWDN